MTFLNSPLLSLCEVYLQLLLSLTQKPLTKPWLVFDHFSLPCSLPYSLSPIFTRISLSSLNSSCLPFCLLVTLPPFSSCFPALWLYSHLSLYPSLCHAWAREICLGIKSAAQWIPAHLVIAVSKPSDNSLNCLPSNLLQDWGGDGNLSVKKKKKKKAMILGVERVVREVKNEGQKHMLAKQWKEWVWAYICNV